MTFKGADVTRLPIISVKDNAQVGIVKDIIYNPKKNKIIGLIVTEGDVLSEPKVIPFKEIEQITLQSVLVKSSQCLKSSSKVVTPISSPQDTDTKVMSDDRNEIGTEQDVIFDAKSETVQEFSV